MIDKEALVPVRCEVVSIVRNQIKITKKIINSLVEGIEVFHVPRDGTLYDAVERTRSGGKIYVAEGKYSLDRILNISKPLSIIGKGKNATIISSKIEDPFVVVDHHGLFSIESFNFQSLDTGTGCILSVSCDELHVQNCGFGSISAGLKEFVDTVFIEFVDLNHCGIRVQNKAKGSIIDNEFSWLKCGLSLLDESEVNVERNVFKDNGLGIRFSGSSSGIAKENDITSNIHGIVMQDHANPSIINNICKANIRCGISMADSSIPLLVRNICEDSVGSGIDYNDDSGGTSEGNICRNNSIGIFLCDNAYPSLISNICENNEQAGIAFSENFVDGIADRNICRGNGMGIGLSGNAKLYRNTCENNDNGIVFFDVSGGTAEDNICRANKENGIFLQDNASPSLISNTCEENEKYGICYLGDSAGTAEGNTCRANKENEIFLYDNANPILLNNIGDDGNEDFGYRIPKRIK